MVACILQIEVGSAAGGFLYALSSFSQLSREETLMIVGLPLQDRKPPRWPRDCCCAVLGIWHRQQLHGAKADPLDARHGAVVFLSGFMGAET